MTVAAPAGERVERGAAAVEARDLRLFLADTPVLREVSLSVAPGTSLGLVGPNGAGKSTLLRVLAGLVRPTSGEVWIGGRPFGADPAGARRSVGMVGHAPMLHPDLSARENLRFYGHLYGLDHLAERVDAALVRVGLSERAASRVATLSRGMVQRLALARALLHEPPILLLDEAEAGLDADAYAVLRAIVRDPAAGRAVVLASHDLHRVCDLADAVLFLDRGRVVGTTATAGLDVAALQVCYAEALARRPERRRADALRTAREVRP